MGETIKVVFKLAAARSFEQIKSGDIFTSQLASRYFNQLFDFPPDHWGKTRHELGMDVFVSDRHVPFDICGFIEGEGEARTLYITRFSLRAKGEHTN